MYDWNKAYRGLYSYRRWVCAITLFPNIFSYYLCMLSEFANVFEIKVWHMHVQVADLHNAVCALSSPSRCFQLSTSLDKDLFCYLWYRCKKTNRMWFSMTLGKFHWSGINWHGFNQSECRICCLCIIIAENHTTSQIWKVRVSRYGFTPNWGQKVAAFWSPWTLFSPAWVQPL